MTGTFKMRSATRKRNLRPSTDVTAVSGTLCSRIQTRCTRTQTRIFFFLLMIVAAMCCPLTNAQEGEQQLKAAFLYHFCSYVQWPDLINSANRPRIIVGFSGTRKTANLLRSMLEGKDNAKCDLQIRMVAPDTNLDNMHMLYVSKESESSLADFPALTHDPPILTITDQAEIPELSIINFVVRDDHLRFVISKTRADEIGLKLSSELLAVALQVN